MAISNVRVQRSLLAASKMVAPERAIGMSRRFSDDLVVVQGAQRSGTTLLYLMLSAHPDLVGLDENEADYELPPWFVMAVNALLGKKTVYKLPPVIWQVEKLKRLYPRCHTFWITRNPFAVTSSMRKLYFEREKQSWLVRFGAQELERAGRFFPEVKELDASDMSEAEIAAQLWVAKQRMVGVYRDAGLDVTLIRYEDLLSDTENTGRSVIRQLGLEWRDEVLEHHRHHGSDLHPGGTRGNKPIDLSRANPKLSLTDEEISSIAEICGETMSDLDYAPPA